MELSNQCEVPKWDGLGTSKYEDRLLTEASYPPEDLLSQWPEILPEPDALKIVAAIRKNTRTGQPLGSAPFTAGLVKIVSVPDISP